MCKNGRLQSPLWVFVLVVPLSGEAQNKLCIKMFKQNISKVYTYLGCCAITLASVLGGLGNMICKFNHDVHRFKI